MRTHAPCFTRELSGVHDNYTVAGDGDDTSSCGSASNLEIIKRTMTIAVTITAILVVESTATTLLNWKSLTKMVRMLPSAQPQP